MNLPTQHATVPGSDPYQDLVHALSKAVAPLQALQQQAVEALAPAVQGILGSGSRDAQWIERTLDQLLNHACLPEGLALFKTLCRHYWPLDPQATASYVRAYREMWDDEGESDTDEVNS